MIVIDIKDKENYKLEKELQKRIKEELVDLGYIVMETGKGRSMVRCPKCNNRFYSHGWQGNDTGVPDLFITHVKWSDTVWIAIECKIKGKVIREKQAELEENNRSMICYGVCQALGTVMMNENSRVMKMKLKERIFSLMEV